MARLKRDREHQKEVHQESTKMLKESEEKRVKIGDGLFSANDILKAKDEEIE
ncbi:hypothetical protein A2U01_0107126, partial [Trifolium medium]|nr:hypothetical protein [Trifolium medium]